MHRRTLLQCEQLRSHVVFLKSETRKHFLFCPFFSVLICSVRGQEQSLWVYERQVLLDYLISFYDNMACSVHKEKAVDVVYLGFDTVSHSFFLEKLAAPGLNGCALQHLYQ